MCTSFNDWRRRQARRAQKAGPSRFSLMKCQVHHGVQGSEAQASAPGRALKKLHAFSTPASVSKASAWVMRKLSRPYSGANALRAESSSQHSSTKAVQGTNSARGVASAAVHAAERRRTMKPSVNGGRPMPSELSSIPPRGKRRAAAQRACSEPKIHPTSKEKAVLASSRA